MRKRTVFAVLGVALLAASRPAFATDGVIEINQAKVLASGGFPYTISVSGSYRLTSNLEFLNLPEAANTGFLIVTANFVSIDLNGFGLLGPAACNDTCVNTGSGDGITVFNLGSVAIRNGFVRGMGDKGIVAAPGLVHVEGVEVLHNGGNGIEIAEGFVHDSIVRRNGGYGIVGGSLVIRGSTAFQNLLRGIWVFGPSTVVDCTVESAPGVIGVKLSDGGSLRGSSVRTSGASPVECDGSCTIGGNTFLGCASLALCVTGATPLQVQPNVCGLSLCS